MQFIVNAVELKNAITALENIGKKVPNDLTPGDASMAILRDLNGFRLISPHDHYTAEIMLDKIKIIGSGDDEIISAWDGKSPLQANNVIGLSEPSKVKTLVGRIQKKDQDMTWSIGKSRRKIDVTAGNGKYTIKISEPKRILVTYRGISEQDGAEKIATLEGQEFHWFAKTISSLGKVITQDVARPAFGNVCLASSENTDGKIQISGNGSATGFSFVNDSFIESSIPFTALIPKCLGEPFSSFFAEASDDEPVDMLVLLDDDGNPGADLTTKQAKQLFFVGGGRSLRIACKMDNFPFTSLTQIVSSARSASCKYDMKKKTLKDIMSRLSIYAVADDAVTNIYMLDGGTMCFDQYENASSTSKPASYRCEDGDLVSFPDDMTKLGTSIRTSVLNSAINVLPDGDMSALIVKSPNNRSSNRLAFVQHSNMADFTAIMISIRSAVEDE